jgi:ADP-dependent NAD(P)H-hydrate dehydratase
MPPVPQIVTEIPRLAPRAGDANKGTFGRALLVAGSRGMSGAAILCGSGALRAGAGLVRVATPAGIQPLVAAGSPCYMTAPLPEDAEGRLAPSASAELTALAGAATAVAMGPGLGRSAGLPDLLLAVLSQTTVPLVLDADALNALAGRTTDLRLHHGPVVITPHPGEFARLLDCDVASVQADRQRLAARFAAAHETVVVLKGKGTIVTDGQRLAVNATGNPGMATGGTGDVLAGVVVAMLCQGLEPFAAARLAVHVHGLAGDLARDDLGETSLIATDLIDYLPRALRAHAAAGLPAG